MKHYLLFLFMFLLFIFPAVSAVKTNQMKLLAVSEQNGKYQGSIADIYLEIRPGKGRVFLETFPASKIDTQIETRFAQQIACNQLQMDCSKYDFIYTIRAGFGLIGGPSAGAAAAILTAATLHDVSLNNSVAITGTINSGGLIGGVGGIKEKVDAAASSGIKQVLIPPTSANITSDIQVTEVLTFKDSYYRFTGKQIPVPSEIPIDSSYQNIMMSLAQRLCQRTSELKKKYESNPISGNSTVDSLINNTAILINNSKDAFAKSEFYPAASYCFRSNVHYSFLNNLQLSQSNETLKKKIDAVKSASEKFNENLNNKSINSITDLQTYLIVKERLIETFTTSETNLNYALAFANERLYSALAWSEFFDSSFSSSFKINKESLKQSCYSKIREAEERFQYVTLFIQSDLNNAREQLDRAYTDAKNENYELCLFKASKSKAEVNIVISVIGADESQINSILDTKLESAKQVISKAQARGEFPIVGYSYYEYSNNLRRTDPKLSLLFAEYALELSNLDIYFSEPNTRIEVDYKALLTFIIGLLVGLLVGLKLNPS